MKIMSVTAVTNSLSYILLCGAAALRWGRLRAARASFLSPDIRNSVRFRFTQTALPERGGPALAPAAQDEGMGCDKIRP